MIGIIYPDVVKTSTAAEKSWFGYIQSGPKKLGLVNISKVLKFYRLKMLEIKSRIVFESLWIWKWPIQSALSWFQMYHFRKFKSKVVMIIVEIANINVFTNFATTCALLFTVKYISNKLQIDWLALF